MQNRVDISDIPIIIGTVDRRLDSIGNKLYFNSALYLQPNRGYEIYDKGGIDSNRLIDFINKFITGKYKNKLIVLDNASSHRNKNVKDLINKDNKLLYSVPYQHFTNVIVEYTFGNRQFLSVLKSKLRKEKDVGLVKLKNNVRKIINSIPEETYKNLFKGSYNKSEKYDI